MGKRHNSQTSNITINGIPIEWKSELKYLGIQFLSGSRLRCNVQIIRQKFFRATNGIFGKIGTKAPLNCYSTLINSYCTPLLTFGMEAIFLSKSDLNSIKAAFTAGWSKIFGSFDHNVIYNCLYYCNVLPIEFCIDQRKLSFLDQIASSDHIGLLNLFAIHGKPIILVLVSKYHLNTNESWNCWKMKIWESFNQSRS